MMSPREDIKSRKTEFMKERDSTSVSFGLLHRGIIIFQWHSYILRRRDLREEDICYCIELAKIEIIIPILLDTESNVESNCLSSDVVHLNS